MGRSKEGTQSILQAKCTECNAIDDNYSVVSQENGNSSIIYNIECDCGETATVRITIDGVTHDENVSYEDASWTDNSNSDEDDNEKDENKEKEGNVRLDRDAKNKQ